MTRLFWELYLPVLAILFGIGILTGVISGVVERAWRRWRVRSEMRQAQSSTFGATPEWDTLTRRHLESLATARDKAERKIH